MHASRRHLARLALVPAVAATLVVGLATSAAAHPVRLDVSTLRGPISNWCNEQLQAWALLAGVARSGYRSSSVRSPPVRRQGIRGAGWCVLSSLAKKSVTSGRAA